MKQLLFMLLICSVTATFAQKADFSGSYKLDVSKTKSSETEVPAWVMPKAITAKQTKDSLIVTNTLSNPNAEDKQVTEHLSVKGTVYKRPGISGNSTVETSLKWLDDQAVEITQRSMLSGQEKPNKTSRDTWKLDTATKTLTMERSVEQADGFKYVVKAVYDKVQ